MGRLARAGRHASRQAGKPGGRAESKQKRRHTSMQLGKQSGTERRGRTAGTAWRLAQPAPDLESRSSNPTENKRPGAAAASPKYTKHTHNILTTQKQADKQASRQASRQKLARAGGQAKKQASRQANKQASKQASTQESREEGNQKYRHTSRQERRRERGEQRSRKKRR